MSDEWLVTEAELNHTMTAEEENVILRQQVSYLMFQDQSRQKQAKAKREKRGNLHHFVKFYKMKNRELTTNNMLSKAEKAFLFDVIPYVNMDSKNDLIIDDRGFPMDAKKLMKVCDIGKTLFFTISTHLIALNILVPVPEDGKVYYKLDPEYFECGFKTEENIT
jgi:hypothetical protein